MIGPVHESVSFELFQRQAQHTLRYAEIALQLVEPQRSVLCQGYNDEHAPPVAHARQDLVDAFANPRSLTDFVANEMRDETPYAAVFIPGGHGAMLGLPDNADLGKVLHWAHKHNLHTLAICHGPAVLLAAKGEAEFLYDGYKMAVFPDSVDKQTPMVGYLPGPMPWLVCEKLKDAGAKIINTKADDATHLDRRLITGASPKAANDFGRLAAETMLRDDR